MRKFILAIQLICLGSTVLNFGLVTYISIFVYSNPLFYLTISGSEIQNKLFDYSFPIGLFSYITSIFLYLAYKNKYVLKFNLLILPTIVWSLYLSYFALLFAGKYFGSSKRLERGWANNDSIYVKEYIFALKDDNVEEMTAKTHFVLSAHTNFCYGMLGYEKKDWKGISEQKKKILKYNIYTVWKEYSNSKLFMNKNCRINFQEIFWSDNKISDSEIKKIHQELNAVADSCNKNYP